MAKYLSESIPETKDAARILLDSIELGEQASVVALQGDLGSGKTTFVKLVGELVGIPENIASPTFVIEKIYPIAWRGFKNLIHIDAYRLESIEEIVHIGWHDIARVSENLIFIEWPERVSAVIPTGARKVSFKFIDETTREIEIHGA
jgi:tRNA threonylcarbamoyladenosine biosynthesis protein TsaE